MNHFEYQIIPADQWRRIKGTPPKKEDCPPTLATVDAFVGRAADRLCRLKGTTLKGDACERPHLVPITPEGRTFAALDAFVRQTDLCPGEIRINGEWVIGYRFVVATETDTLIMLSDLNEEVEEVFPVA